jgi:glycosyltransferase involved in cell wall biosynthesis
VGGTELNMIRTAERLDRAHVAVSVILLGPDGPLRERCERAGIPVRQFIIGGLGSVTSFRSALALTRFLRDARIDVLHAHDIYANVFGVPCARAASVPVVLASRRWWRVFPRRGYRTLNQLAYRMADRVIANSPAVADMLAVEEGVPSSKIICVPNFVDDEAFVPVRHEDRRAFLSALDVPSGAQVIGCAARLEPVKNHALLLRALATLTTTQPRAHVVLVGDGSQRRHLESLATELGLTDRVHFAGERMLAWNVHAVFDVSVLCSTSEAFPNAVVEAMAAGRPVVATDVGGVRDAVLPGETGLLVASNDVQALARALSDALDSATLRDALGARGAEIARQRFHARTVIDQVTSLYRALAFGS